MMMVSEKKKGVLKGLLAEIEKYPVVGILDMHQLPARQLCQIKEQLKGNAVIKMVKKRVIKLALEQSKKPNITKLEGEIENQPALLFSEGNPFELAQIISKSSSKAAAKAGDIAPDDIVIPAGPTNLPPGPAVGELQKAKIPAGVEGDKIVVKKDTCVVRKGEEISAETAGILSKLGVEPMDISLNLVAVWDDGTVFDKEVLFVPKEHYVGQMQCGYACAFNLSVNIGFVTPDTVPLLLAKAKQEAMALAAEAGIMTPESAGNLLAKANAQAMALKGMVKEAPAEEKPAEETPAEEEKKEEPKEEESAPEEKDESQGKDETEGAEKSEPEGEKKEE